MRVTIECVLATFERDQSACCVSPVLFNPAKARVSLQKVAKNVLEVTVIYASCQPRDLQCRELVVSLDFFSSFSCWSGVRALATVMAAGVV